MKNILEEIANERNRQEWGELPMKREVASPFSPDPDTFPSDSALKNTLDRARKYFKSGQFCWFDVLIEQISVAFLNTKPEKQCEELIQAAAVIVAIIEYLDKKAQEEHES